MRHHLEAIDPATVEAVALAYSTRRATGLSELAAHNAALAVLREHLPNWPFRAAADMVSRIVSMAGQKHQAV